ncbi:MAG TPA: response regulator [Ktedonobacterales bacterium]
MADSSGEVAPSSNFADKKVLIIDDTETIVTYIRHVLLKLGFQHIVVAYDGIAGLEQYYAERPDCVIVDVKMPGLDGNQVVRTIRGDAAAANTPLLILSALQEADHKLTGMLSGVDEYLSKPVKPSALAAALERVMKITPEQRAQRMEHLANDELVLDAHPEDDVTNG